jgi:hypothetical protein
MEKLNISSISENKVDINVYNPMPPLPPSKIPENKVIYIYIYIPMPSHPRKKSQKTR